MNRHQWVILAGGGVAMALLIALGTSNSRPTLAGPIVEHAPGVYSQTFTDQIIPFWTVAACLGLMMVTGALIYHSRRKA